MAELICASPPGTRPIRDPVFGVIGFQRGDLKRDCMPLHTCIRCAQETAPGGRVVRTIGIVRAGAKIGLQTSFTTSVGSRRSNGRRLTAGV